MSRDLSEVGWWSIWFVPTEEGQRAFDWRPRRLSAFKASREDAELDRYLEDADEPAPDKHDYRRIELRRELGAPLA